MQRPLILIYCYLFLPIYVTLLIQKNGLSVNSLIVHQSFFYFLFFFALFILFCAFFCQYSKFYPFIIFFFKINVIFSA